MKDHRHVSKAAFPLYLVAFFLLLPFAARAEAVKSLPQPTDYVSDFAHVLSPEAVTRLDSICEQLDHSQANSKVAVVTINSLDGDDAADYANQLEDHWKMGDKGATGQNRFALVLLAVNDHKYRIEIGYGLEGILPDGKTGDIGRDMIPDLRARDYDGAMTTAVGEIAQVIAADAHISLTGDVPSMPAEVVPERHESHPFAKLILILIVLIFFGGFSLLRMFLGWGLFFGGWGRGGWGGGGGGFGGGGFGGGGSGGGGFSGFGGGGGGFGGGGAGGSW
jgi:uncharacterized protein